MRVVVIGGSGHIGTYLVPMLVERNHEVINVSRGERKAYLPHAAWNEVQAITADREAEDTAGTFGTRIRDLKPDVVIDLICFTEASAKQITEALRGNVQHFLHCGTIWIYGHSVQVPAKEDQARRPLVNMASRKQPLKLICSIRRIVMASRRQSFMPGTSLDQATCRSTRQATSTLKSMPELTW